MYISYSNLWKYLIDRKLSKTELMSLAGISSRTLAKLSKNQTVTTDTLVRICEALGCSISDIMEVCDGDAIKTLYEAFKSEASLVRETEHFKTYRMTYKGVNYLITKLNRILNKHTSLYLREDKIGLRQPSISVIGGGTVSTWEQFLKTKSSESFIINRKDIIESGSRSILVIPGGPLNASGLDDNNYISYKRSPKSPKDIYVMTMTAFKLFNPTEEAGENQR